ncbi:RsmD family RNA methyltransferase [Anaplasma bovis]|uniref:RsmD family RNA methyltransferase n=1 Tax=Anaplasma bovis TaxID=186733 RepID=UPI002FF348ED
MIRITSGAYRGMKVFTGNALKAQPVISVIREAVFNILRSYISCTGLHVCDLFCGSGSMSFEALSRGAAHACMVDSYAPNLELVKKTASNLGVKGLLNTICCDIRDLPWAERRYDLAFVDPPYAEPELAEISLRGLVEHGWCSEGSYVVLRIKKGGKVNIPSKYELLDRRAYCASEVLFMSVQA